MESGTQLGHYEIGKGGMGEVWKAKDTKLGREVAIKTLPEGFARDANRLARLTRKPGGCGQDGRSVVRIEPGLTVAARFVSATPSTPASGPL